MVQEISQSGAGEQQGAVCGEPAMSPVAVPSQRGGYALVLNLEKFKPWKKIIRDSSKKNYSKSHFLSGVSGSSAKKSHYCSVGIV